MRKKVSFFFYNYFFNFDLVAKRKEKKINKEKKTKGVRRFHVVHRGETRKQKDTPQMPTRQRGIRLVW